MAAVQEDRQDAASVALLAHGDHRLTLEVLQRPAGTVAEDGVGSSEDSSSRSSRSSGDGGGGGSSSTRTSTMGGGGACASLVGPLPAVPSDSILGPESRPALASCPSVIQMALLPALQHTEGQVLSKGEGSSRCAHHSHGITPLLIGRKCIEQRF